MLKQISQVMGLLIGSAFSPSWFLLNKALEGYFNLHNAMSGPVQMLAEFNHFNLLVASNPDDVLYHLCPQLILILILGCICVTTFSYLFSKGIYMLIERTFPGKALPN